MAQTIKKKYMTGEGLALEVSTDAGVSFDDVGMLAGGVVITHNFDKTETEPGNAAKILAKITNQTLAIAPSALWTWDFETIAKLSGGLLTYSAVAGTPVSGASQVVAAGWAYNKFIKITNQNYNLASITPTSVTGSVDGPLVADTDFYIGKNEKGESGIFIIDSADVTTLVQTITIVYGYTPSAGTQITSGDSSLNLSDFVVRLRRYTDVALTTYDIEIMIYSADLDGGMSFNFKGVNEDGVNEITFSLTGKLDETRSAGDQLFKMYVANGAFVEV